MPLSMSRRAFNLGLFGGAIPFTTSGAFAQGFPARPLRLIVGVAPGGSTDVYARTVGDHMARTLGQAVVIENQPGANGNLAAGTVLKAPADGYTIWMGTQSMTEINPSAYPNLPWKIEDFTPLIRGVQAPLALVVHPDVPARTLPQLVAWAKANPAKASYASFSAGTPSHFLGHQLNSTFGLDMVHVPFPGGAPQSNALIAGHVPIGFTQIQTAQPLVEAGKLVPIATTGASRYRTMPNVPTLAELGHPNFTTTIWFGLLTKAGTPEAVFARLHDAATKAHQDSSVRKTLEAQSFEVSGETGPGFLASIRTQQARWAAIVKATGFKAGN